MRVSNVPFMTIDWSSVAAAEHAGASGKAVWRTVETGNVRVRLVEHGREAVQRRLKMGALLPAAVAP